MTGEGPNCAHLDSCIITSVTPLPGDTNSLVCGATSIHTVQHSHFPTGIRNQVPKPPYITSPENIKPHQHFHTALVNKKHIHIQIPG